MLYIKNFALVWLTRHVEATQSTPPLFTKNKQGKLRIAAQLARSFFERRTAPLDLPRYMLWV
jgi:hypothetical protein